MPITTRRFGDRRGHPRFEILGQLWGSLETVESLELQNVSTGGALVESPVSLAVDSIQRLRISYEGTVSDVQARVMHVRTAPTGAGGDRFLIGLEFLSLRSPLADYVERLVAANPQ